MSLSFASAPQFVRFARRLSQVEDAEKDSDSLEELYNVAGEAASAYHLAQRGGGAQRAR